MQGHFYCELRLDGSEPHDCFAAFDLPFVPVVGMKLRIVIDFNGYAVVKLTDVEPIVRFSENGQQDALSMILTGVIETDERVKGWGNWKREDKDDAIPG